MSHEAELPAGHFHHWEPEQAYHGSKLGMWLFLATEVHLFSGLFAMFAFFRWKYPAEFAMHAHQLNWKLGALNTTILLISSYLMVRAVDSAQHGDNSGVKKWLSWTILFGLMFFVVKGIEYNAKFSHDIYPSTHIFWGLYFLMTGIHALHVAVGLGIMVWLWLLANKNRFSTTYYTPVEVSGLYWHLVDIIWIYLFPIVYLVAGISMGAAAH
jgi:cytochrome c oxidase subunit 3